MELLQTSNSFPYAVALQFKGDGTDNLNTLGRRSGNRVAITMSPGENMRCNQVICFCCCTNELLLILK